MAEEADKDLLRYPDDPPKDWRVVHRAIARTDQSWPIMAPLVAITTNWRAWLIAVGIYAFVRGEGILAALDKLTGVGP